MWDFDGSTGTTLNLLSTLDFTGGWTLKLTGTGTPTGNQDLLIATGGITGFAAPTSIDYGTTGWSDVTVSESSGHIILSFGAGGDINGDGVVDAADYILLKQNCGNARTASADARRLRPRQQWHGRHRRPGPAGHGA